jgi:hypothetical protein
MAKRKVPDPRGQIHETGEAEPCSDCREELAFLGRVTELREQEGLVGGELVERAWASLRQQDELEEMWRRRPRRPKRK